MVMSKGTVLIPTLNEEEVIGDVIAKLDPLNVEVIVIDANSSDKTREKAKEYGAKIINKKINNDLANSVLTGIKEASNNKIVVMDGDGQHPIEPVEEFLDLLDSNSLVIGYREKVEDNWPLHRRFISWGADFMARTIFRECRDVNDPLSGFFGLRRSEFNLEDFEPQGYKIIIEFLVKNNGSVAEIGYNFRERQGGSSSIGLKAIMDYKMHLANLKYRTML